MADTGSPRGNEPPDRVAEADRLAGFAEAQSALVLAVTADGQTLPEIGTLPFVRHGDAFWVLASELASHTRPLLDRGEARVALLADSSATRNPFARERAHWAARVESVERGDERFATITTALLKPLMIRFRTGKLFGAGGVPVGNSEMTAPVSIIR